MVRGGARRRSRCGVGGEQPPEGAEVDATVLPASTTTQRMAAGELTPDEAMQQHLITQIDGQLYPVTLLGRWIDRGQGRDDAELEREARQRGAPGAARAGDVPDARSTPRDGLLDYRQLYALWERQNWKAHELDFSVDREHWLTHAQRRRRRA